MNLLLVCPSVHKDNTKRIKPFWLPPLNLAIIAGLTPSNWDITLVDENVEDVDFTKHYDLVGISSMTANSRRAYEIADTFRRNKIPVVFGGSHASVCSEEVGEHADCVVIGEAEPVWNNLLNDLANNSLKKIYKADLKVSTNTFGKPRRELYNKENYLSINTIQTSKGCPYKCSFCSIASRFEGKYGMKPLADVISEVEELADKSMPIFFVDDNFLVNRTRSKKLLTELKRLKITWWSQADITIMNDPDMLDLMRESGCIKVVVGFESISVGSIEAINKNQNKIEDYVNFVKTLRNHGILVNSSFAFGTDYDNENVFIDTFNFLKDNEIIFATFNILTPLPGTQLFLQLKNENRLTDLNWDNYDMGHTVFQTKNINEQKVKEGYDWICHEFYSFQEISKRVSTLRNSPFEYDQRLIMGWNLGYKRLLDTFGVFM
ncbi:MAG: B12-binding domain-containing radical SAM protein [Bacteroidales bacterium]|nr:B12-binding domain-containing radical SAM protein [Bacteroidales bacterium]